MDTTPASSRNRAQSGAALITSLILLLVMTLLATTTMNNATLEERMASNAAFRERAFQAAESAASEAFGSARSVYASSMDASDADGIAVQLDDVSSMSDLDGTARIRHIDLEGTPACGASSIGEGASGFALRYFEINADGQLQNGDGDTVSQAEITAGATICGPS